jgi:hypothetical protein
MPISASGALGMYKPLACDAGASPRVGTPTLKVAFLIKLLLEVGVVRVYMWFLFLVFCNVSQGKRVFLFPKSNKEFGKHGSEVWWK